MNTPHERPVVIVNALKLHEAGAATGNFYHVLHLAAELVKTPNFDLRFLTDEDSHVPFKEAVGSEALIRADFRGNAVFRADRFVASVANRLRPAIYHRPTGQLPFVPLKCRTIAGVADLNFRHLPTSRLKRLYKEASYRWTFARADRVVCVSNYTREDVLRQFRVAPEKLRVVQHGTIELPPSDLSLAASINQPYYLAFAHQPHKNAEVCIEALRIARVGWPELALVVIGLEERVASLRQMVSGSDLQSAVRFVGAPSAARLAGLYEHARGLIFPSRFEGFGLPLLEAMTKGCPVICSNVCSLPEVAGDAAIQVAPTAVSELAAAMGRLGCDEQLRASMVEKGFANASRFSWARAARETLDIYSELVSQSGQSGFASYSAVS